MNIVKVKEDGIMALNEELVSLVSSFFNNTVGHADNYFSLLTVLEELEDSSNSREFVDVFGEKISSKNALNEKKQQVI